MASSPPGPRISRRRECAGLSPSMAINFMKPCVSPFSRRGRPGSSAGPDEHLATPAFAISASVSPTRPSGGSMYSGVGRHPVVYLRGGSEQVVRDDLVVVVRGMRERALAVAVAQRPDVGRGSAGGRRPTIYPRASVAMPALSRPRSSVLQKRPTPSNTCDPVTSRGGPARQSRPDGAPLGLAVTGCTLRRAQLVPSRRGIPHDRLGDIRVFAGHQPGTISTTVTSTPKRRKICANSRPA